MKKRSRTQGPPRRSIAAIVAGAFVLLLLAIALIGIAPGPAAVVASDIVTLTNQQRVENDVGTLNENSQLDAAAQAKADDMATKGYFAHESPDGTTPWDFITAAGYQYQYAGENLAVNFTDSGAVMDAWMASPTHRANIVKAQYTDIGVGVAQGMYEGEPATFVVQEFGTPAPSSEIAHTSVQVAPQAETRAVSVASSTTSTQKVEGAQTQTTSPPPMSFIEMLFNHMSDALAFVVHSLPANTASSGGSIDQTAAVTSR